MGNFYSKLIAAAAIFFVSSSDAFTLPVHADHHERTKEVIGMNNKAVNLMNHGKYFSAYNLLNAALKKDPHYELARSNLSIILLRWSDKHFYSEDIEKALRYAEKAEFYAPFSQEAFETTKKCILALKLNPESAIDRLHLANQAIARNAPDEFSVEIKESLSLLKECSHPLNAKSADDYYDQCGKDLAETLEKRLAKLADEKPFHYLATVTVFRNGSISVTFPPKTYTEALVRRNEILTSGLHVDWSLYKRDRSKNFNVSVLHCIKYDLVTATPQNAVVESVDESDTDTFLSNDNTDDEAIKINNRAIELLHQAKYKEAIVLLKDCMKLFPDRELFRSNYAIALNNYALALQHKPEVSLRLFEQSLFHDFDNITTQHNADGILKMLKLNPSSILVRLELGNKALARNDLEAAITEFKMAMKLTPRNLNLNTQLKEEKDLVDLKKVTAKKEQALTDEEKQFYSEYMKNVTREIKSHWAPVRSKQSSQVVLTFDILKNGKVANIQEKSSTNSALVKAAVNAVKRAAPFDPPLKKVDIQFTFDYNVFAGGGGGDRSRSAIKKTTSNPRVDKAAMAEIEKYQALLAEKQIIDDKSEEVIDLRIKLVKLLVKQKYIEFAEHLLEEGCDLSPENQKLKEELVRVKKMIPRKPQPLPKNVS